MAAKWSGRARIAGMARSYKELLQATGNWDIGIKKPRPKPRFSMLPTRFRPRLWLQLRPWRAASPG